MKDILMRVINRAKKWMLFLIVFPILTAGIAYFLEKNTPAVFTAKAIVEVGNFENERLTDPKAIQKLLKSTTFLEEIKQNQNSDFDVKGMKNRVVVTPSEGKFIEISLSGSDKKESEETLSEIVDGFVETSDKLYDQKVNIVKTSINNAEKSNSPEDVAKRAEVLYDLNMVLTDLKKTEVIEPVEVAGEYKNPVQRAVFGLLLGFMLIVFLLVTPELFRDYTKD